MKEDAKNVLPEYFLASFSELNGHFLDHLGNDNMALREKISSSMAQKRNCLINWKSH